MKWFDLISKLLKNINYNLSSKIVLKSIQKLKWKATSMERNGVCIVTFVSVLVTLNLVYSNMKFIKFILICPGNIGSTCGFVTGFSFVSALEFVYFFTVKLCREIKRRGQEETAGNTGAPASPPYETIKRYHSLYWNELVGPTRWKFDNNMLK